MPGDASHFDLPLSTNFDVRRQRQSAYYIRNYYEFKGCQDSGGFVTFYTFTFNDRALKKINGHNVLDNDALHWFLRDSGLRKAVRRFGFTFKYFVAPEFGEGKGSRGYGNNPHFHGVFYFYPLKHSDASRDNFLRANFVTKIFRRFWQGNEYPATRRNDPRLFTYGKLDISTQCGALVKDFKAIKYTSKYVVKDSATLKSIENIRHYYLHDYIPKYLYEIDRKSGYRHTRKWLVEFGYTFPNSFEFDSEFVNEWYLICLPLCLRFREYVNIFWERVFRPKLWRSHYPKVFTSKGFGLCALDHVSPEYTVKVPDNNTGWYQAKLPLYLKRKIFYDVVKSPETGSPCYRLNNVGIAYMHNNLPAAVNAASLKCHNSLERLRGFSLSDFFDFCSLYDEHTNLPYFKLVEFLDKYENNSFDVLNVRKYFNKSFELTNSILFLHQIYNLIYKHHSYTPYRHNVTFTPFLLPWCFDSGLDFVSSSLSDYEYFKILSYHNADYRTYEDIILDNSFNDYVLYSQHPAFSPFMDYFKILDFILDYFHYLDLKTLENKFYERKRLNNFHRQPA